MKHTHFFTDDIDPDQANRNRAKIFRLAYEIFDAAEGCPTCTLELLGRVQEITEMMLEGHGTFSPDIRPFPPPKSQQ